MTVRYIVERRNTRLAGQSWYTCLENKHYSGTPVTPETATSWIKSQQKIHPNMEFRIVKITETREVVDVSEEERENVTA